MCGLLMPRSFLYFWERTPAALAELVYWAKPAEDAWEFSYWFCKTLFALPFIMKGLASLMLESYFDMVYGMLALGGAI
jgi:hypothetical protein